MMQADGSQELMPGMAVIANINKRCKVCGTIIAMRGDIAQVELQQAYRGADQRMHMSVWKQQMPMCKLSRV